MAPCLKAFSQEFSIFFVTFLFFRIITDMSLGQFGVKYFDKGELLIYSVFLSLKICYVYAPISHNCLGIRDL